VTSGLKRFCATFLGLTALVLTFSPAVAKPLLSEACVELASEHTKLRKGGVEEVMDQDPQKAGETLNPEDLAKIERYLFIEGQIRFRCPKIKLPKIKDPNLKKSEGEGNEKAKRKPPKKPQGSLTPPPNQTLGTQFESRG
jgi:hypothetical protein